ncbi:MAG TPA: hypothetical protein VJA16_04540 [Thermoanaerobaculia bacterium]
MTNRRRSDRLIVTLPPDILDRLRVRGAHPDRTHGPYNYTTQLTRTLGLHESLLVRSDPRETQEMPGDYLLELPDCARRARALGLEPADFARAVNALTFAEKLHLVDSAQIRHASLARRSRGD